MSLREVIRSKLKSLDRDKETASESIQVSQSSVQNGTSHSKSPAASSGSPPSPLSRTESGTSLDKQVFKDGEEKTVYELQLVQLQEQLVAAMIENQTIASELKDFKDKNGIEKLTRDLELEKQRSAELSKRLNEAKFVDDKRSRSSSEHIDEFEVVDEAEEAILIADESEKSMKKPPSALKNWLLSTLCELIADFTEEADPEPTSSYTDGEQLSVKSLKENIKRFKDNVKPIANTFKGIRTLLTWRNPSFTLIVFVHGEAFSDLGVSDKFNLVLQVARQVQNALGSMADSLEKLKNLVMWKQPEATCQLFLFLAISFLCSCLLSGASLALLAGLFLGMKLFIIEYIYARFPRFKQRHDTVDQMWKRLPTDRELEERSHTAAIGKHLLTGPEQSPHTKQLSEDDQLFCNTFNLPPSERPKPGWAGGRRCTLIDKDKSWTSAFVNGRLYLTRSFLCFERVHTQSTKNALIPLKDITNINKAKPYSWLPGAGMSIEVCVTGYDKPYLFGALLNRDEIYEQIISHAATASLPWATHDRPASASGGNRDSKQTVKLSDLTASDLPDVSVLGSFNSEEIHA